MSPSPDPTQRRAGIVAVLGVLAALAALAVWVSFGRTEVAQRPPPGSPDALSASPASSGPGGRLDGVDWAGMDYRIGCGGTGTQVQDVQLADLDGGQGGDSAAEALVTVRCAAGAGSPPSTLLVFDAAAGGPRLLDRLVEPADDVLLTSVRVRGGSVQASGTTYSSAEVPRCCPDQRFTAVWRWTGAGLERTG